MNRRDWLFSVIAWDGCLPALVAAAPTILPLVIPGRDLGEVAAVTLVPFIAALVRAHYGSRQLANARGLASIVRQVCFGLAIAVLLIFDMFLGVMNSSKDVPPSAWFLVGLVYLVYLGLIVPALWPLATNDAKPAAVGRTHADCSHG